MLTQMVTAINWVDIMLLFLFGSIIFLSLQTGFITELMSFLGVIVGLYVGFHYYLPVAEYIKPYAPFSVEGVKFLVFCVLVLGVIILFKLLHDGSLNIFDVQTKHQGFDQYGAAALGAVRGWLLCSVVLFGFLLLPSFRWSHELAQTSWSHKILANAAPDTYSFLYHQVVGKIFGDKDFNKDVYSVTRRAGKI